MKQSKYKSNGWYGESYRHSLASKGIKTNPKYMSSKRYYAYEPTFVAGDLPLIGADAVGTAGAAAVSLIPLAVTAGAIYVGARGIKRKSEGESFFADKIDLDEYEGVWKQVAISQPPPWFQRDCDETKAKYELQDDGTVKVTNTCMTEDGPKMIEGTATPITEDHRKLAVDFGLFQKGEYEIVHVNDDYSKAVVKGGRHVWVLEKVDEDEFNALKVPKYAKQAAKRALKEREEFDNPPGLTRREARSQGINSGVERAKQLVRSDEIPDEDAKRVAAFYQRFKNRRSGRSEVAIDLWGGRKFGKKAVDYVDDME